MNDHIYLSNISYEIGTPHSIDEIEGPYEETLNILGSTGIKNFCRSDDSVAEMAEKCVEKTLSKGGFEPEDFGFVVYAATDFTLGANKIDDSEFDRIMLNHGLVNAYLHGVFLSNCTNLMSAIQLGSGLLRSSERPHILLILSDKLHKDGERIMDSAESILSDGATAFVLSKEYGEYELKNLALTNDLEYLDKTYDIISYFKKSTENLKSIYTVISNGATFEKVFMPNYSLLAQRGFKSQLKLKPEQIYLDNLDKIGHVFASDVLINFFDYLSEVEVSEHSLFAFLTAGNFTWGGFMLERTDYKYHKD